MVTVESAAAENPALQEVDSDPTLVCSAYKKNRFYLYTKRIPGEDEEREVRPCEGVESINLHGLQTSYYSLGLSTTKMILFPCNFNGSLCFQ